MKSFCERERSTLEKLKRYQLPNSYKKVGFLIAILCMIGVFTNRFTLDSDVFRFLSKCGIILGLLIISISKEKIEDEWISKLRMMSYSYAFILAVVYSFILPFVIYGVQLLLDKPAMLEENGDFVILWMLLSMQILFFHLFKKVY